MSYVTEESTPSLLAADIGGGGCYFSLGIPDDGLPRSFGYTEQEIELDIRVFAAWEFRSSPEVVLTCPTNSTCLKRNFAHIPEVSNLSKGGPIPRFSIFQDCTIAIATSISSLRFAIMVLGDEATVTTSMDGSVTVCSIEDGIGAFCRFDRNRIDAVARRLDLNVNYDDGRIVANGWALSEIGRISAWNNSLLREAGFQTRST